MKQVEKQLCKIRYYCHLLLKIIQYQSIYNLGIFFATIIYKQLTDMDKDQFQDKSQQYQIIEPFKQQTLELPSPKRKFRIIQQPKLQFKLNKKSLQQKSPSTTKKVQLLGNDGYFNKNFECGNLQSVHKINYNTFLLTLANDTNTQRYSQWFYFSCKNLKSANFIIRGFKKTDSLYNFGMKLCIKQGNSKWGRGGQNISYKQGQSSYQLHFCYKFSNPKIMSLFAYSFPYSYSDLKDYISDLEKKKLNFFRKSVICKSFQGRDLYCFSIGNQSSKQVIVITARVHPGETVSSYILRGFIQKLIGDFKQSQILRQNILFIIIPMLNPDGVFSGNYRTSFTGNDLNRKWNQPNYKLHPQIYHTKIFIQSLKINKRILMVLDLHAHSRKKNTFFYGCQQQIRNSIARQFPYIMSKVSAYFKYQNCNFNIQKQKNGTARIAMWKELRLSTVYTLEASFSGNQGTQNNYHIQDYQKIGQHLVDGFSLQFIDIIRQKIFSVKNNKNQKQFWQHLKNLSQSRRNYLSNLYKNKYLLTLGFFNNQTGSQSSPEDGLMCDQDILSLFENKNEINHVKKSNNNNFRTQINNDFQKKKILTQNINQDIKIVRKHTQLTKKTKQNYIQNKTQFPSPLKIFDGKKQIKIHDQPEQIQNVKNEESITQIPQKRKTHYKPLSPTKFMKRVVLPQRNSKNNHKQRLHSLQSSQIYKIWPPNINEINKIHQMNIISPHLSIFGLPKTKIFLQDQQDYRLNPSFEKKKKKYLKKSQIIIGCDSNRNKVQNSQKYPAL